MTQLNSGLFTEAGGCQSLRLAQTPEGLLAVFFLLLSVMVLFGLLFYLLLLVSLSYWPPLNCSLPKFLLFLKMPLGINFLMLCSKKSQFP